MDNKEYKAIDPPEGLEIIKLRVIEDIPENWHNWENPHIPKGSITWIDKKIGNNGLIENNRHATNFKPSFFEVIKKSEEFVLPEKWCIRSSNENEDYILNSFVIGLKNNHWTLKDNFAKNYIPHFKNGKYYTSRSKEDSIASGYTEISFEQFKKYVLKEENKKNDFIVGRWYKYTSNHLLPIKYYAKYSNNQPVSDKFYFDEQIIGNKYFCKHDWSTLSCNQVLLEDLSEIQEYLPEGHIDKIKKETKSEINKEELLAEAKRRYPVGTKYYSARVTTTIRTIQDNHILEIRGNKDIATQNGEYVHWNGKWAEIIELPKESQIVTFKKGQKVKVLRKAEYGEQGWSESWSNYMNKYIEQIGEMISDQGSAGIKIKFSDGKFWYIPSFVLELVKEQQVPEIEYYVREWPSGTLTMGCAKIPYKDGIKYFKSLEDYSSEGGVRKDELYGFLSNDYEGKLQRKATKEEIDYFLTHETLTTYKSSKDQWVPKVGEWCYYLGSEAEGIDTSFWQKGLIVKFDHKKEGDQYCFKEVIENGTYKKHYCSNLIKAFRKAEPHEIPGLHSAKKNQIKDYQVGDWIYTNAFNTGTLEEGLYRIVEVDTKFVYQPCVRIEKDEIWCYPKEPSHILRKATGDELHNYLKDNPQTKLKINNLEKPEYSVHATGEMKIPKWYEQPLRMLDVYPGPLNTTMGQGFYHQIQEGKYVGSIDPIYLQTGELKISDYLKFPKTLDECFKPETSTNSEIGEVEPVTLPKLKKLN